MRVASESRENPFGRDVIVVNGCRLLPCEGCWCRPQRRSVPGNSAICIGVRRNCPLILILSLAF